MATDSRASIRDRILQFKGKNLYLPPPLWMGSHLELFRCTFEPPQRDSGLGSALGTSDKHPGKEASGSTRPAASLSVPGHVERLSKTKNRTMKYKWIEKILEHEACGLKISSRKSLKFFFRRKMIQQYESLVFLPVSCHDQSVIVAYVDFSTITEARRLVSKQRSFSTREWTDLQNTPVEPILLSILVSMIQAQRSPGLFFGSENTGHFQCCPRQLTASTPKLLFTKADDFEHIHLYQAKVPTEFLRQFDDTAFETSSSITVEHIEIPFAPFESFGARVVDTLRLQTPRERILEPSLEPSLDDRSAAIHPDCQSGGGRKRKLGNDDVESYDVRKKQGIILRSTRGNMSNCSASRDRQVA